MIKKITITTYRGDVLTLDLFDPIASEGFLVNEITGLGPVKANINTTSMSSSDGARFNSSRMQSRNIVFNFTFMTNDDDIEAVRIKSYLYFPLKREIKILVETDHRVGEITGYIESNEPNIFSEQEGCQISVICPDPYFYSPNNDLIAFSGVTPAFQFPMHKDIGDYDHIIMGELERYTEKVFEYTGDVESGMTFVLNFKNEARNVSIHKIEHNEIVGSMVIDTDKLVALTGQPFIDGDVLTITTSSGNKKVILNRNGDDINILNCVNRDAVWFQLSHGTNVFSYAADIGESDIWFKIYSRVIYEGM